MEYFFTWKSLSLFGWYGDGSKGNTLATKDEGSDRFGSKHVKIGSNEK
ncbi:hypothetical protein [Nostoc sphaeroides]